jgi:hypothetical protein
VVPLTVTGTPAFPRTAAERRPRSVSKPKTVRLVGSYSSDDGDVALALSSHNA